MAIKLNSEPLNRKYYINNNVIYKIENTKSGGAVDSDGNEMNSYIPTLEVKKYTNGSSSGEPLSTETVYLDQFFEVGDVWDSDNAAEKVNGISLGVFFFDKCRETIKEYVKSNVSKVSANNIVGQNLIPIWAYINDADLNYDYVISGTHSFTLGDLRITPDTVISISKETLIREEVEDAFANAVKKYNANDMGLTLCGISNCNESQDGVSA